MKHLRPCAGCGSKDAFVIDEVVTPDYQSSNCVDTLTITAAYAETGEVGLLGAKHTRYRVRLEAQVCAECGYTQLYSKDLDVLAQLARRKLGNVRRVVIP
jgi:predicted nucleic-acid-binding Zn-ribbon protein